MRPARSRGSGAMPLMTNHQPPRTDPAPADRDWFGGRRWTGIAALGVVILVLLCVIIVLALHHNGGPNTATSSTSPTPSSTAPKTSAGSTAAPSSPLPTTMLTTAPNGTVWTIFDTVALPSIPGQGPAHIDGALATGYAHTPTGALLAVANDTYRFVLAGPDQWRAVVDATIAPGPGKSEAIQVLSAEESSGGPSPDTGTRSQIAGFRFVSYTPSDAVIQLVTRDVRGTLQVLPQHVEWSGTDWLLVLPAQLVTPQIAPSLAGFIPWGGV